MIYKWVKILPIIQQGDNFNDNLNSLIIMSKTSYIYRILETIESVVEEILVWNTSEPVVITRSAFAVSQQRVDLDQEIGQPRKDIQTLHKYTQLE